MRSKVSKISMPTSGKILGQIEERRCEEQEDIGDAVEWTEDGEEDDSARVELGLVGKIWTKRSINANAFMATIKNVWQPSHGLDISSIGENTFVVQFYHWRDKNRVLEGQPWHFDKHAIILGDIEGDTKPSDMELFSLPMWVRIYNLPFKGRMNVKNIEAIGKKIGSFVKVDNSGSLGIDKSLRMRVLVDVRKALTKKVKVKMRGGEEEFFEVKYEKPPLYGYYCGKIGHGLKDCGECTDIDEPPTIYGGWLKASPWKRSLKEDEIKGREASCAKMLFVTKPKKQVVQDVSKQMLEVVHKLDGWEISATNTCVREGASLQINDKTVADGEPILIKESEGREGIQVENNGAEAFLKGGQMKIGDNSELGTIDGMENRPLHSGLHNSYPKEEKSLKKKGSWKRVERKGEVGEFKGVKGEILGGMRRKMMEKEVDHGDPMQVDTLNSNKKRAISPNVAVELKDSMITDMVAGLTDRALGEQ